MQSPTLTVNTKHNREFNEYYKDARRLTVSAFLLALIFAALAALLYHFHIIGMRGVLPIIALLVIPNLVLIPVIKAKIPSPQRLYAENPLCPAIIAEVRPRDVLLLALVPLNTNASPDIIEANSSHKWGLAARTITMLPNTPRRRGEKVPVIAVRGKAKNGVFTEVTPLPLAWATTDQVTIAEAHQRIPSALWNELMRHTNRIDDILKSPTNTLPLS